MNSLCDKNEARAIHPPEPKQGDGAVLWAVIVVIALASAALWLLSGVITWY